MSRTKITSWPHDNIHVMPLRHLPRPPPPPPCLHKCRGWTLIICWCLGNPLHNCHIITAHTALPVDFTAADGVVYAVPRQHCSAACIIISATKQLPLLILSIEAICIMPMYCAAARAHFNKAMSEWYKAEYTEQHTDAIHIYSMEAVLSACLPFKFNTRRFSHVGMSIFRSSRLMQQFPHKTQVDRHQRRTIRA